MEKLETPEALERVRELFEGVDTRRVLMEMP